MKPKTQILSAVFLAAGLSATCSFSFAQELLNTKVVITGAMRETMWNGQLAGLINLDSLDDRNHTFGLGPVEYLQGEIMLMGDTCFVSKVDFSGEPTVEKRFDVTAPFFVHTRVDEWKPFRLPAGVINLETLQAFLDSVTLKHPRPFAFCMEGRINTAKIHIMNLPPGTPVHEPADAHRHQVDYTLENAYVRILGFFSTQHQRIFTHHDTFLHLHLITSDGRIMGHVDELEMDGDQTELQIGF